MKRIAFVSVTLALLIALLGYAAADAMDKVPGVLTIAPSPPAMSSPLPSAPPEPSPSKTPVPSTQGLQTALAGPLADPALGSSVGMAVLDATTGEQLYAQGAESPRTVASLQKLISGLVVSSSLPLDTTFKTTLVEAPGSRVVLQAGGDLYVNPGAGDPNAVVGRAGMADLADQAATALTGSAGPWVMVLDTTLAGGPEVMPTWDSVDVAYGYTGRVSNLGLSSDRADEGKPSPPDLAKRAATTLVGLLQARGVNVTLASGDALHATYDVRRRLGEISSAPLGDLLRESLRDSDNALMEQLARFAQARSASGQGVDIGTFLTRGAVAQGIPEADLHLLDASGLSSGQTVTVNALAKTLQLASDGSHEPWRQVVLGLPIAGLTGTLAKRFDTPDTREWAGIPREKTGTLTGISAVGGWTVDADGRTLLFVVVADEVSPSFAGGTEPARVALDRLVGALTNCGCR